jgi:type IV secretion system protein VirD4
VGLFMTHYEHNEHYRFGSGGLADAGIRKRAGIYKPHGLFIGQDERGRACFSNQQAAMLLVGGARAGKGDLIIPWLVDGHYRDHIISMDWKAQNGCISQLQVLQGRDVVNWDPRGRSGYKSVRISPTSHLKPDCPNLTANAGEFASSWLPASGSANAKFFEQMAQIFIHAISVETVRRRGSITLPQLSDYCTSIGSLSDEWLSLEFDLRQSNDRETVELAMELDRQRQQVTDTGGFEGIKNELKRSFGCMRDQQLRASVSNPNWDFSELTKPDARPTLVNLMEDQRYSKVVQPVFRALYNSAAHYKMSALDARPQAWLLDEVGNIDGGWPMVEKLATYAAGYGIRAIIIVQSLGMLDRLIKDGAKVIPQSCGTQIYMGIRSLADADVVSRLLGSETRTYDDFALQERARHGERQAIMGTAAGTIDPLQAAIDIRHNRAMAAHRSVVKRPVRTPDEIINTPKGGLYVFMPGELERPSLNYTQPYWQRRDLSGRFLRDPYHSPEGVVEVKTFFGQQRRNIITETVPEQYAHLPQYADGRWQYVEGFKP